MGIVFLFLSDNLNGQVSKAAPTPLVLSSLSDEQWVKEMDGLFNVLRYLCDEDELKIMKVQVGLTDKQMEALKKYQAAFTHTNTAAKSSTIGEKNLSAQERDKLADSRYEKALKEQILEAHEFRKIIGLKDFDLKEWGIESGTIFENATNALWSRKKNGYPDPDFFSEETLKEIRVSKFYNDYLSFKKNEIKDPGEFDSFVTRHETQIKEQAALEVCGQSIQFAAFENKNLVKALMAKRNQHLQTLLNAR